jgi:catechol 2,3-dioxygenase-like lactoylglutathione lyase family enzyme
VEVNIQRLTLETPNLETLRIFYGDVLELPVSLKNNQLQIKVGTSELIFLEKPESNAKYHFAFNIPEQQPKAAKQWLEARVKMVLDDLDRIADVSDWNAHAMYFYDPAGNILELIARHDLNHEIIEPFDSSGLLNISEIGLAVPKTTEFATWLETQFEIPPYQKNTTDFMPLGDANGLIIAVLSGREWYPNTKILANPYYIKIELVGEGEARFAPTVQYLDLPYWFSRV